MMQSACHSARVLRAPSSACLPQVSALALEPMGSHTWLCVDGEVVPFERIYAEVHRGMCCVICAA